MKILDIGGYDWRFPNSIILDKNPTGVQGDVVFDIERKELPFANDTFDKIYSSHTIEHVKELDFLLREIWRITKPDGIIILRIPHFSSHVAYSIEHCHYFSLRSFDEYFVDYPYEKTTPRLFKCLSKRLCWLYKYYADSRYGDNHKLRFKSWKHRLLYPIVELIDWFANLNHTLTERGLLYWFGGFDEIYLVLQVKKGLGRAAESKMQSSRQK